MDSSSSREHGLPYGVVMVDVDSFKACNDHYGHLAGDRVLAGVAEALKENLRQGDQVFRYGGEELIALLPRISRAHVLAASERLRGAVQALGIEHCRSDHGQVTISLGAAHFVPASSPETSWTEVVARADEALYRAKRMGRNRVEAAFDPGNSSGGSPAGPRGP